MHKQLDKYPTLVWVKDKIGKHPHVGLITHQHPYTGKYYNIAVDINYNVIDIVDVSTVKTTEDLMELGEEIFYPPVMDYNSALNNRSAMETLNGIYDPETNPTGRIIAEESLNKFIADLDAKWSNL